MEKATRQKQQKLRREVPTKRTVPSHRHMEFSQTSGLIGPSTWILILLTCFVVSTHAHTHSCCLPFLQNNPNTHSSDIPAETVEKAPAKWCKQWWKACRQKIPNGTRVADLRAQILEWQQVLRDTGRLQIETGTGNLPWRLSPEAVKVVDARIEKVVYPHGPAGCSKDGAGFIKNMNRARRISQKLLALLVLLPTVLRDYVPELRHGLRKLVLGLKLLEGRCISAREAIKLNVPAGSRPLFEEDIEKARILIIEGLSMLEGMY